MGKGSKDQKESTSRITGSKHVAGCGRAKAQDEAYIMNRQKKKSVLRKEGNVYVLDLFVKVPPRCRRANQVQVHGC